jgi:subtilisin family serine protease
MKNTSRLLVLSLGLFTLTYQPNASANNDRVTVAVIDTGADLHHSLLQYHLWRNPGEIGFDKNGRNKSTNGIDDDGNGFIDDVNGWNFANSNGILNDLNGHGTHIAGIIAEGNTAKIMVLKAFDLTLPGSKAVEASVAAIKYATAMKVDIINYSGGGLWPSDEERKALKLAEENGILVVAAAGNEKSNSDDKKYYPAGYGFSNILSVAAVDQSGHLLPSSNWGKLSVQVAAQGKQVLSSLPENQFGAMTGTSQATALVTRTAAMLMLQSSLYKNPKVIIRTIAKTGDPIKELKGKIKNPVVVNQLRALEASVQDFSEIN